MNDKDLSPAQDRLADALLAEHARLGRGDDEQLISAILAQTVQAPATGSASPSDDVVLPMQPLPQPAMRWTDFAKMAAVVAVCVGACVLGLQRFQTAQPTMVQEQRQEHVFQLVVADGDAQPAAPRIERKVLIVADRDAEAAGTDIHAEAGGAAISQLAIAEHGDLDMPIAQFERSLESLPAVADRETTFMLASDDTVETTDDKLIYSGNVVLTHAQFTLTADSLVIDQAAATPVLKALNAKVQHRDGGYRGSAETVSFVPSTGELSARGVTELVDSQQDVAVSPIDRVIFDGGEITIERAFTSPAPVTR